VLYILPSAYFTENALLPFGVLVVFFQETIGTENIATTNKTLFISSYFGVKKDKIGNPHYSQRKGTGNVAEVILRPGGKQG
jgi:hypothetical protein